MIKRILLGLKTDVIGNTPIHYIYTAQGITITLTLPPPREQLITNTLTLLRPEHN